MPFAGPGNLPLHIDPKLAWATANLTTPLEVNRASRDELLRVPGIGPRAADSLVRARRSNTISELAHLRYAGVRDVERTGRFLLLNGRRASSASVAAFCRVVIPE